ncbi:MAG: glycosyltransferase family 4 protein [Chloroflexi bacterium]|nr:glycosyltransferase family 4 protein [Chloroflexota bacterium]
MARFLFLTQYFPPEIGAAAVRLDEITRAVCAAGHSVEVVTGMPNYPAGRILGAYRGKLIVRERDSGRRIIRTWTFASSRGGMTRRLANYASLTCSSLIGCFLASRPDYVFVESPPLFLGLTAWMFCRITGSQYIVNVSDPWLEFARDMGFIRSARLFAALERLERFIYKHALRVNAVTATIRTLLIETKGVPRERLSWLPNGVDLDRFRPLAPDPVWKERLELNGHAAFVYAGSHQRSHALDVLLDAASLDRDLMVVLVGDGTEKARLIESAQAHALSNVRFVEPQRIDQVPRILSVARGALVSIRGEESFDSSRPAKMFAAMACGKPIIYCGRGEGASIVSANECGVVVPPGDAQALVNAMRRMAQDPELAERAGRNGRLLVERTSAWRDIVRNWLADLEVAAPRRYP